MIRRALIAAAWLSLGMLVGAASGQESTAADPRFVAALATAETPIQYAPDLQRFWDADARKLGAVVRGVGKLD